MSRTQNKFLRLLRKKRKAMYQFKSFSPEFQSRLVDRAVTEAMQERKPIKIIGEEDSISIMRKPMVKVFFNAQS